MDTVLDRNGNKLQVTMYCYPARMWVLSDDEDVPVACSSISRVNGVGFEWEDEQYADYELLDNLHGMKTDGKINIKGKWFRVFYREADYCVGVDRDKVLSCRAIDSSGLIFCVWKNAIVRGSQTYFAWSFCNLESIIRIKGINKLYGIVNMNNTKSNKYFSDIGATVIETFTKDSEIFNKYEYDCSKMRVQASGLRSIWESNNIGDFDNPSILVQDGVYVG